MTALVSCAFPSLFHICPEFLIMAGMEASIMMSLGTCKFVIPRSESTIAKSGPSVKHFCISASTAVFTSGASPFNPLNRLPKPLFASMPACANSAPNLSKTDLKNALTQWPKIMGSETFIMVAFICSENNTP